MRQACVAPLSTDGTRLPRLLLLATAARLRVPYTIDVQRTIQSVLRAYTLQAVTAMERRLPNRGCIPVVGL